MCLEAGLGFVSGSLLYRAVQGSVSWWIRFVRKQSTTLLRWFDLNREIRDECQPWLRVAKVACWGYSELHWLSITDLPKTNNGERTALIRPLDVKLWQPESRIRARRSFSLPERTKRTRTKHPFGHQDLSPQGPGEGSGIIRPAVLDSSIRLHVNIYWFGLLKGTIVQVKGVQCFWGLFLFWKGIIQEQWWTTAAGK